MANDTQTPPTFQPPDPSTDQGDLGQVYQSQAQDAVNAAKGTLQLAAKGVNLPGKLFAAGLEDVATDVSNLYEGTVAPDEDFLENVHSAINGEKQDPFEQMVNGMKWTNALLPQVGIGVAKLLPTMSIANTLGLGLAGAAGTMDTTLGQKAIDVMSHAVANGTIFGLDEDDGFNPIRGALMAAAGPVSDLGKNAALSAAKALGVDFASAKAEQAVGTLGGFAATQALFDMPNVPKYLDPNVSTDDKFQTFAQGLAMNVAMHLMSVPGIINADNQGGAQADAYTAAHKAVADQQGQFYDAITAAKKENAIDRDTFLDQLSKLNVQGGGVPITENEANEESPADQRTGQPGSIAGGDAEGSQIPPSGAQGGQVIGEPAGALPEGNQAPPENLQAPPADNPQPQAESPNLAEAVPSGSAVEAAPPVAQAGGANVETVPPLAQNVAAPAENAPPEAQGVAGAARRQISGVTRPHDLIDELQANLGGKINLGQARQLDSDFSPVGAARGLFSKDGTISPDDAAQAVAHMGIKSDEELLPALNDAAAVRVGNRGARLKQESQLDTLGQQLEQFQADAKKTRGKETIIPDTLNVGDSFTMQGKPVRVMGLDFDDNGEIARVHLEDGNAYGVQTVEAGGKINVDKGSVKSKAIRGQWDADSTTDEFADSVKKAAPAMEPSDADNLYSLLHEMPGSDLLGLAKDLKLSRELGHPKAVADVPQRTEGQSDSDYGDVLDKFMSSPAGRNRLRILTAVQQELMSERAPLAGKTTTDTGFDDILFNPPKNSQPESVTGPPYFDVQPDEPLGTLANRLSMGSRGGKDEAGSDYVASRRLTAVKNAQTGEVMLLPTFREKGGMVKVTDPDKVGGKAFNTSLKDLLARRTADGDELYSPIASLRTKTLRKNFVQKFDSQEAFEQAIGQPAREQMAATGAIPEPEEVTPPEEPAEETPQPVRAVNRETADAVLHIFGAEPNLTPERFNEIWLTEATQNRRFVAAFRRMFQAQADEDGFDLSSQENVNKVFATVKQKIYETLTDQHWTDKSAFGESLAARFDRDERAANGDKTPTPAEGGASQTAGDDRARAVAGNVAGGNDAGSGQAQADQSGAAPGPVLPPEPNQEAGGGPVLSGEQAAPAAADRVASVRAELVTKTPPEPGKERPDTTLAKAVGSEVDFGSAGDTVVKTAGKLMATIDGKQYPAMGEYDPSTNTITISEDAYSDPAVLRQTLLHEGVHAATFAGLHGDWTEASGISQEEFTARQEALRDNLGDILSQARAAAKERGLSFYGLGNVDELMAEAFTDGEFQKFLGATESATEAAPRNLFSKFVDAVRNWLGLKPSKTSLLSHVISLSQEAEDLAQHGNASNGQLITSPLISRNPADVEEAARNQDYLMANDVDVIATSQQLQNKWTELPVFQEAMKLPANVLSKLRDIFPERTLAYKAAIGRWGDKGATMESVLASDLPDETKGQILGDSLRNMLNAEAAINARSARAQSRIDTLTARLGKTEDEVGATRVDKALLRNIVATVLKGYQSDLADRIKAATNSDKIDALRDELGRIQEKNGESESLTRVITEMSNTLPPDLLTDPSVKAKDLVDAYQPSDALGLSDEAIQEAARVLISDRNLGAKLQAFKDLSDPNNRATFEDWLANHRKVLRASARADSGELAKAMLDYGSQKGKYEQALSLLTPRMYRLRKSLNAWTGVRDALDTISKDQAWKQARHQVYDFFSQSIDVSRQEGPDVIFKDPMTGGDVAIRAGLDSITNAENQSNLMQLWDHAQTYVGHPEAEGWDPQTAIAWRYLVENGLGGWMAPELNPFTNARELEGVSFMKALAAPGLKLRTIAGREARGFESALSAYDAVDIQTRNLSGLAKRMENANRMAARESGMSVHDWQSNVASEIVGSGQYAGQMLNGTGKTLRNGHVVTDSDMAAVRMQKQYSDAQRAIVEGSSGMGSILANPSRIATPAERAGERAGSRTSVPTSPYGLTMSGLMRPEFYDRIFDQWKQLTARNPDAADLKQARIAYLSGDSELFDRLVMGQIEENQTPGYAIKSVLWKAYREADMAYKRGEIGNWNDLIDTIHTAQLAIDPESEIGRAQVEDKLLAEVGQGLKNAGLQYENGVARAKALVNVSQTENAFSLARGDAPAFPRSYLRYGLEGMADRLRYASDAKAFFIRNLLGEGGAAERLSGAYRREMSNVESIIKQLGPEGEQTVAQRAKMGDLLYNYNDLRRAKANLDSILGQMKAWTNAYSGQPSAVGEYFRQQREAMAAQILTSPQSRITHTLGNAIGQAILMRRLGLSIPAMAARRLVGIFRTTFMDAASMDGPFGAFDAVRKSMADGKFGSVAENFAQTLMAHQAEGERLKQLGYASGSSLLDQFTSLWLDAKNVVNSYEDTGVVQRSGQFLGSILHTANEAWMHQPMQARYNDFVLNRLTVQDRARLVQRLARNAVEAYQTREAAGLPTDGPLTTNELLGEKGTDANAAAWRGLFSVESQSLDQLMKSYYDSYKAAKGAGASGEDLDALPFLTQGQTNSLDFAILKESGLATTSTRMLLGKGSQFGSSVRFLHSLPVYQMQNFLAAFNRMSNDTKAQYLGRAAAAAFALGGTALLAGYSRQIGQKIANKLFYKEETNLPTIADAKNAGDFLRISTRALASWFPIVGDFINAALLNQPDRFGHLDSLWTDMAFATDLVKMGNGVAHGDFEHSLLMFARRWSPPARMIINRLPSETGVTQFYNASRLIASAIPTTMEQRMRQGGGEYAAAPITPFIRAMQNDAINRNQQAFMQDYQAAIQERVKEQNPNPAQSVAASFAASNPWTMNLKSLPTDTERAIIMANLDPSAQQAVQQVEQSLQTYGSMIGANVNFTAERAGTVSSSKASEAASGLPVAGSGEVLPSGGGRETQGSLGSANRLGSIGGGISGGNLGVGGSSGTGVSGGRIGVRSRSGLGRIRGGGSRVSGGRLGRSRTGQRNGKTRLSSGKLHVNNRLRVKV